MDEIIDNRSNYDKRFNNNICADSAYFDGVSPMTSSDYDSSIPSNLLYDFTDKDEEDTQILLKQDMITRYDKRIAQDHEDNIEDDIAYYYIHKCWNPFKYCNASHGNIQCMNVICKSICILVLIVLASTVIVFILHDLLNM